MGQIISGFIQTRLSRNTALALAFIFIGAGLSLFVQPAHAQLGPVGDAFVWAFGSLVQVVVGVLGTLLINLFYVLIAVANYNQFLASSAVSAGWVVVRDIVNMFFVLVLLAIAIGTILQRQQYHYAQALPKFLAAAVLVNFSKTIAGIFIDFAQVVMMTFVGAISGAAGGNLAALLGIPGLLKQVNPMRSGASDTSPELVAFGGFFLAMMFVAIAIIVVGILIVMLVIRIVALWFLIILSPAAFFLMALPNDKGYSAKWWDQFINYLLVGPITMFFLWLSLSVVASQSGNTDDATKISTATELGFDFRGFGSEYPTIGGDLLGQTGIATIGGIASYILGICMLMATLMAAQQLSSVGGNLAGAGAGYVKDWFAGKRGPFNPFRNVRETLGGVMARREERRKERVKERVRFADEALGTIQGIPRGIARAGVRRAMATAPGRHIREWYGSEQTQTALDWTARIGTAGLGGWGTRFQERMQGSREGHQSEATKAYDDGGEWTREAKDFRIRAQTNIEQARGFRQQAAAPGINPVDARALNARANTIETDAQRFNIQAANLEADAGRRMVEGQTHEAQAIIDAIRMGIPRVMTEAGRFLAAGATGGLGAAALYGIPAVNAVGREGDSVVLAAKQNQSAAIKERAGKLPDDFERLIAMLHGTKPGTESELDRKAAAYKLMEPQFKEQITNRDVDAIRRIYGRGAIGEDAREMFEGRVAESKHTQVVGGLSDLRLEQLLRTNKIDMKKATPDMVDIQLIRVLSRLPGHIAHEITKDAAAPVRNTLRDRAQEHLRNLDNGVAAPRNAAGLISEEYAGVMRTFANAGGNTSNSFGYDANGMFIGNGPLNKNDLQQIITADPDENPALAHLADLMPQIVLSLDATNLAATPENDLQTLLGNLVSVNQLNSLRRGASDGPTRHKNNHNEILRMFEAIKKKYDANKDSYNKNHEPILNAQAVPIQGIRDERITVPGLEQRRNRAEQTL